jgi:predicted nucleotidyltransferase
MFTKKSSISRVKQFLAECNKLSFTIDKAIIFGSAIQGKATENSDIDLALFSDKFSDNILNNLDMIGPVNIRFPEIDVHTYPLKQYKQKGIIMDQIKKTGIEIKI